jgi:hypothetical protein
MRPGCPAVTVVGFASSLAAAIAILPLSRPLATDAVALLVVWAAAVAVAESLVRAGRRRLVAALTFLLCVACLAALAVEALLQLRLDRPGVVLALLGAGLASLVPALLRWRRGRQPAADGRPRLLGPSGERTLPLPRAAAPNRVLHGRWQLEPGPLDGADRGGFSILCRATDLRQPSREVVVVKLASRSYGMETDSVARLLREGELLGELDSPHVIGLLDSGWEAGAFFLVLDYHPAGSLARWLGRRFVLELSTAVEVTSELLRALAFLHELDRPVIHRDITPRNILVASEWPALRLVLTDFGSARRLDDHGPTTEAAITVGSVFSPFYAPPELVGGPHHGWWGPETDIYGACALLYELLTGLPPYQREAHRERVEFQRLVLDPTVVPTPPGRLIRGLPVILDRVLAAGLAHDPAARPARATDLLGLLQEVGRRHGTLRIPFADLRHSA